MTDDLLAEVWKALDKLDRAVDGACNALHGGTRDPNEAANTLSDAMDALTSALGAFDDGQRQ